nr:MAG TPA: hypothetical protein [Caudoviricetes sp.]
MSSWSAAWKRCSGTRRRRCRKTRQTHFARRRCQLTTICRPRQVLRHRWCRA